MEPIETINEILNYPEIPSALFDNCNDPYANNLLRIVQETDFFIDNRHLNKTFAVVRSPAGQAAFIEALDTCLVHFYYLPIRKTLLESGLEEAKKISLSFLSAAYGHLGSPGNETKIPAIHNSIWITRRPKELKQKDLDNLLEKKNHLPGFQHILWVYDRKFAPKSVAYLEENGVSVREISEIQDQFIDPITWHEKLFKDVNLGAAVDLAKVEVGNVVGGLVGDLNHEIHSSLDIFLRYDCVIDYISFFMCKPHGLLEQSLKTFYASHSYENMTQGETRLLPFNGFLEPTEDKNIKLPHFSDWKPQKGYSCGDDDKICISDPSVQKLEECNQLKEFYDAHHPHKDIIIGEDRIEESWDEDL